MVFNVLSLSLIFVGLVTKCLGVLLLGVILPGTLLPGLDYFLSHVRKVSGPFSPPSETPMMWVLVHLMLSQRSLRRSSSFFFLFSIPCSASVVYTVLSSRSFTCSPASFILLLIPSSVLFMFVCSQFFQVFGKHFLHFLHCFPEILDHLQYHYSELFFWKAAELHLIRLFFCGSILSFPRAYGFLLFILANCL